MPEMPPVDDGMYLIEFFREIGPVVASGMSVGAFNDLHVRAWRENTSIDLAPWESRWLIRLSKEYAAELHAASDVNRPPPWIPDPSEEPPERKEKVARHVRSMLREQ